MVSMLFKRSIIPSQVKFPQHFLLQSGCLLHSLESSSEGRSFEDLRALHLSLSSGSLGFPRHCELCDQLVIRQITSSSIQSAFNYLIFCQLANLISCEDCQIHVKSTHWWRIKHRYRIIESRENYSSILKKIFMAAEEGLSQFYIRAQNNFDSYALFNDLVLKVQFFSIYLFPSTTTKNFIIHSIGMCYIMKQHKIIIYYPAKQTKTSIQTQQKSNQQFKFKNGGTFNSIHFELIKAVKLDSLQTYKNAQHNSPFLSKNKKSD